MQLEVVMKPTKNWADAWCDAVEHDGQLYLVGGLSKDRLAKTKDGVKFTAIATKKGRGLRSLAFGKDVVWKCGEYGTIAMSKNGMKSWTDIDISRSKCLHVMCFTPDGELWVGGDEGFLTHAKGTKFKPEPNTVHGTITGITNTPHGTLLTCGSGLYRFVEDGVENVGGVRARMSRALATPTGTILCVGSKNKILRSTDGGATFTDAKVPKWKKPTIPPKNQLKDRANWFNPSDCYNRGAVLPDGRIVVAGDDGVIVWSADDGKTFKPVANTLVDGCLWMCTAFNGSVYLGGENGIVLRAY